MKAINSVLVETSLAQYNQVGNRQCPEKIKPKQKTVNLQGSGGLHHIHYCSTEGTLAGTVF